MDKIPPDDVARISASPATNVKLVNKMAELGRLKQVELRDIWENEAQHFTPWLAAEKNLSVLADTLDMELELEAQEMDVGPFRADILCRNADGGSWVLIENQLERTNHSHLGQLLTYAAGLHAATICWIAENFTEEHRATLDWLNEITDDRFQFFGLEIELWQIGNSLPAPKFNVISKPNDWSRSVTPQPDENMTPTKRLQKAFWSDLMKRLVERRSPVRSKKPKPQGWMSFSVGHSKFRLVATLQSKEKWVSVYLSMMGPSATAHFRLLERQREKIEEELSDLEWRALPGKEQHIRLRRKNADPMQQEDWPNQLDWMVSTLEGFDKTFRPRLKSLDASDWHPDDATDD